MMRDVTEWYNVTVFQLQLHSCEICSEAFSAPKYLRRHLLMVHNQEPPSNQVAMDTNDVATVPSNNENDVTTLQDDATSDDVSFTSVDAALQNGFDMTSSDAENDVTAKTEDMEESEPVVAGAVSVQSNGGSHSSSPIAAPLSGKMDTVTVVASQPEQVTVS